MGIEATAFAQFHFALLCFTYFILQLFMVAEMSDACEHAVQWRRPYYVNKNVFLKDTLHRSW